MELEHHDKPLNLRKRTKKKKAKQVLEKRKGKNQNGRFTCCQEC